MSLHLVISVVSICQSTYSTVDMTSIARKIVEFAKTVDGAPSKGRGYRRSYGPQFTLNHFTDVLMGKKSLLHSPAF